MSGAVVFKGTRIPVQTFFDHLDHGGNIEQFLEWYDGVTREQLESSEEIHWSAAISAALSDASPKPTTGLVFGLLQQGNIGIAYHLPCLSIAGV
jgi:hypothetical protein